MTRPISSKSATLCHGAAGDAVEIQQAGGMEEFKRGLDAAGYERGYEDGYKAGIAAGYAHAFQNMDERIGSLEKSLRRNDGDADRHPGLH